MVFLSNFIMIRDGGRITVGIVESNEDFSPSLTSISLSNSKKSSSSVSSTSTSLSKKVFLYFSTSLKDFTLNVEFSLEP